MGIPVCRNQRSPRFDFIVTEIVPCGGHHLAVIEISTYIMILALDFLLENAKCDERHARYMHISRGNLISQDLHVCHIDPLRLATSRNETSDS